MNEKNIAIIGGARPNFMKVAPLIKKFEERQMRYTLINTGQHFDKEMAGAFFEEFQIKPDYNLTPSHSSIVLQFADIMSSLEKIFLEEKPKLVVVVGDVNSTLATALVAHKMNILLAHVEAGLRSYNRAMPEEINRILTDRLSDLLFVTMEEGVENLKKEGIDHGIHFVGNIMIDTLEMFLEKVGKTHNTFYFCTMHRGENVDNKKVFKGILDALEVIARDELIYLPLHPRTKKQAVFFGFMERLQNIFEILPPLSYTQSLYYQKNAKLVLTDSGGVQEETSYVGTPCITLRTETERPITVRLGTNTIGGITKDSILAAYSSQVFEKRKTSIPFWDGASAERIVRIIQDSLNR